jgi:hypothetical protein
MSAWSGPTVTTKPRYLPSARWSDNPLCVGLCTRYPLAHSPPRSSTMAGKLVRQVQASGGGVALWRLPTDLLGM